MAKRARRKAADESFGDQDKEVPIQGRDIETMEKLQRLASAVAEVAKKRRDPYLEVPSRSLSNSNYNRRKRLIEMGDKTNRRELFNLNQARAYMQTILVGSGCSRLIRQGKSTSIRGMYYMLKHNIEGTKENTFEDQSESDTVIEDLEVITGAMREELHLYAEPRGNLAGPLVVIDGGNELDASKMGAAGYPIPSIVEPDRVKFKRCDAKFILHVEKGTVWQRFNEDKFWQKHKCIVSHGAGQPARGVRRMLYRLHSEYKLPVYCLLDNDPWGYYIYSVIKQGSINLAFESMRMAIPDAKFIGLRSSDYERCGLKQDVKIKLDDKDKKRAKQIASYPWFSEKKHWQAEIKQMLTNDFKLEVEALISRDISYVTEKYVPERLRSNDWLD
ncbi:MAG: DNA topoisomerase IV subunit A [Planctomycetota bacterium]|jgi:DNA topoisomerase-6 subunit A|nr:DNA topoisomerase IV subunit A [Planctomycetota bacterium]